MGTVVQQEETLEQAEHSLLKENSVLGYLVYVELLLGGVLTTWGFYRLYQTGRFDWLSGGLIVSFLGVSHFIKRGSNRKNIHNIQAGKSGERFVQKILRNDLPDHFFIMNDVSVEHGNRSAQIDHLILSSSGIYVIETKAYGGALHGGADDEYWTQEKSDGTRNTLTNPISQNQYHIDVLLEFLSARNLNIQPANIHSFVAMVNSDSSWSIDGDDREVFYAWHLPDKLLSRGQKNHFSKTRLRKLFETLDIEPPQELIDRSTAP